MGNLERYFEELLALVGRAAEFSYASDVLEWDQQVNMPEGGNENRSLILSTVRSQAFDLFTSNEVGNLVDKIAGKEDRLRPEYELIAKRLIEVYNRARRIPSGLFQELTETKSKAHKIWVKAKQESNFKHFLPSLKQLVDLNRELAERYGYKENPYDALLEGYEPGMTTALLKEIFNSLKEELIPFLDNLIKKGDRPDKAFIEGDFSGEKQKELCVIALEAIGYDFKKGRLDVAPHPFTVGVAPNDVRVTTRFNSNNFGESLLAVIHEGGHALFELGKHPLVEWLYLNEEYPHGIHEANSRMWEEMVGRSYDFWEFFYPKLQKVFPRFKKVDLFEFWRAINIVKPSLIRVTADEVTYNLHILIRFEIEEQLIRGEIDPKDLPEIWNQKMEDYLGIVPPDDSQGVLQDIHWSMGYIGYFPTYTLGNIYAAQLFSKAKQEISGFSNEIATGNFYVLLDWLRKNVYPLGLVYKSPELIREVTGEEPSAKYWLRHIKERYSKIYQVI